MKNAYKFSVAKNNINNDNLKTVAFVAEDLMTKYLRSGASGISKEAIGLAFDGSSVFENVSPDRVKDSYELLNNKITAGLLTQTFAEYNSNIELKFDKDTFVADLQTQNILRNPQHWKSYVFQDKFAVNYGQVISPIAQSLAVGFYDNQAQIHNLGWGDSFAINVESNEVLVVSELAQDTLKVASQTLKNKEYTAKPRPYGAGVSINFYHLASGKLDWGKHILSVAKGFARRWNQMAIESLYDVFAKATTNFTVNTPYFKTSLTDANWNAVVKALDAANDGLVVNAYGDLDAITQILPNTTVATMDAALSTLLGKEWTAKGFVGEYHGANVYKLGQVFLPGTINGSGTSAIFGAPEDIIWFTSEAIKNLHLVFEGTPITIERTSFETGDGMLRFTVISNFDMIYVPGSKIGAILVA